MVGLRSIIMKIHFLKTIIGFITTALGFVSALAWNNAVLAIFTKIFGTTTGVTELVVYAVFVSSAAVLVTYFVGKALQRMEDEK